MWDLLNYLNNINHFPFSKEFLFNFPSSKKGLNRKLQMDCQLPMRDL